MWKRHFLWLLVIVAGLCGCGPAEDPKVAALRSELMLTQMPSDSLGILEAKEKVDESPAEVVVSGQVTSGEFAFWDPDQAMFAVSEVIEDEPGHGGEGHDPSTCPFCKRRQADLRDRRAMVKVLDSSGNVAPYDARTLLGIEENQRIVLQGSAEVDKSGNLIVKAKRVFLP